VAARAWAQQERQPLPPGAGAAAEAAATAAATTSLQGAAAALEGVPGGAAWALVAASLATEELGALRRTCHGLRAALAEQLAGVRRRRLLERALALHLAHGLASGAAPDGGQPGSWAAVAAALAEAAALPQHLWGAHAPGGSAAPAAEAVTAAEMRAYGLQQVAALTAAGDFEALDVAAAALRKRFGRSGRALKLAPPPARELILLRSFLAFGGLLLRNGFFGYDEAAVL
jgi:hypothetical protein